MLSLARRSSAKAAVLCLLSSVLLTAASAAPPAKFTNVPLGPRSVTNLAPSSPTTNTPSPTNTTISASTNAMDALDNKYYLVIGDRLSFRILEDEEDPKPLPLVVTDSGDLEIPLIGRFPAKGKTCKDLALSLKTELEKEYYYHATVIIAVDLMTRTRGKIYFYGPVRSTLPQDITFDETLTLSKAIMRAGGFGDFADKRNVRVIRKAAGPGKPEQTFTIDMVELLEKGRSDLDLPLEPDDTIHIPERLFRF